MRLEPRCRVSPSCCCGSDGDVTRCGVGDGRWAVVDGGGSGCGGTRGLVFK